MINGTNLGLRSVEISDLSLLKSWRNNDDFRRNFREHKELSDFNQNLWYEKIITSPTDYIFVIEILETREPIGVCGLLYINWITRSADFSFYIGKNNLYIDEIYSPEAVNLLLNYGFNVINLHKIWMELYEYDKKKIELFTKSFNFKIDGRIRDNVYQDGIYFDSFFLSLLKNEF